MRPEVKASRGQLLREGSHLARQPGVLDLPVAVNFAIADHRLLICADDRIYAAPLDHLAD
jgi:hypothetical protein